MKRFLVLALCILILIACYVPVVYAEGLETAGVDHEFLTFLQGAAEWGDLVYSPVSRTDCTLRKAGCAVTSITILMAYADPELRDVSKWNPYICAQTQLSFGGKNGNDLTSFDPRDPSFNYIGSWSSRDKDAITAYIKDKLENGYYCMLWGKPYWGDGSGNQSSTHFSPVVGIDPSTNDIYVWDTTWGDNSYHRFLDGTIDGSSASVIVHYYESTKNDANETILLHNPRWGSYSPDGGGSAGATEEEIQLAVSTTVHEWELNGMPSESDISCRAAVITLADGRNLDVAESFNIQSINDKMSYGKKDTLYYIRVFSMVLGLLMLSYALILWLGYLFDRSNTAIQLSMVTLFTFGALRVETDTVAADESERGYITVRQLYVRIGLIVAIGFLLVSGILLKFVSLVTSLVDGI